MPEDPTAPDLEKILIDLMQLAHKKQPTVTDSRDVALLDSLIERAKTAVGARFRSVKLNVSLERVGQKAEQRGTMDSGGIKVLGIVDYTLDPDRTIRPILDKENPTVAGTIKETGEPFYLLASGEELIMVILPKESDGS